LPAESSAYAFGLGVLGGAAALGLALVIHFVVGTAVLGRRPVSLLPHLGAVLLLGTTEQVDEEPEALPLPDQGQLLPVLLLHQVPSHFLQSQQQFLELSRKTKRELI
jgi:hypothetical protein